MKRIRVFCVELIFALAAPLELFYECAKRFGTRPKYRGGDASLFI